MHQLEDLPEAMVLRVLRWCPLHSACVLPLRRSSIAATGDATTTTATGSSNVATASKPLRSPRAALRTSPSWRRTPHSPNASPQGSRKQWLPGRSGQAEHTTAAAPPLISSPPINQSAKESAVSKRRKGKEPSWRPDPWNAARLSGGDEAVNAYEYPDDERKYSPLYDALLLLLRHTANPLGDVMMLLFTGSSPPLLMLLICTCTCSCRPQFVRTCAA